MKKITILILFFLNITIFLFAENFTEINTNSGRLIFYKSGNSLFPHPARREGYNYDNEMYSFEEHYNDSTIAIFIPVSYQSNDSINLVIHFHGWYNNVDSVIRRFDLINQFVNSGINAILILPQGPKNAPDSFGGKLEEKDGFKNFVGDIVKFLNEQNILDIKDINHIILSGHSGGYRVIAFILLRGGMTSYINEVYLFDGLYSDLEKYSFWMTHTLVRFINVYTDNGGTKAESLKLLDDLEGWGINHLNITEPKLTNETLRSHRIVFIHSDDGHNDVISKHNNFERFLKTSAVEHFK
jgi:hypothetical protein